MNLHCNRGDHQKAVQSFEEVFGPVRIENMQNPQNQILPTARTFAIYCLLNNKSCPNLYWEKQLARTYKWQIGNGLGFAPLKDPAIYKAYFESLVYCG